MSSPPERLCALPAVVDIKEEWTTPQPQTEDGDDGPTNDRTLNNAYDDADKGQSLSQHRPSSSSGVARRIALQQASSLRKSREVRDRANHANMVDGGSVIDSQWQAVQLTNTTITRRTHLATNSSVSSSPIHSPIGSSSRLGTAHRTPLKHPHQTPSVVSESVATSRINTYDDTSTTTHSGEETGYVPIHIQSFALLLLQHLGPLGVQFLEEAVRGHQFIANGILPTKSRESSSILASGPQGVGRAVLAARNLAKSKALDQQRRHKNSIERRKMQIMKESKSALEGALSQSEVVSSLRLMVEQAQSTTANKNANHVNGSRGAAAVIEGIDMKGFVLAAMKCLSHANLLCGSCSYPWERKCLRTATGQLVFSDLDTVGRSDSRKRRGNKGSGLIGAFDVGTMAPTSNLDGSKKPVGIEGGDDSADDGDDAIVLTAVGESSSKGGGEERLDFLPDSVRRHGGVYFGSTDTFPFYFNNHSRAGVITAIPYTSSSINSPQRHISSSSTTHHIQGSSTSPASSPRAVMRHSWNDVSSLSTNINGGCVPDDQQVMDAFVSAISRYYSPVELTPAILSEVKEAARGKSAQGLLTHAPSQSDVMFGRGSAAATPTSFVTNTTNDTNTVSSSNLPLSQYVSQALWYSNGPSHWEFPTICPSHSLPPNPLLDARLLPYALMRLFREIDRSSADQLEWEAIAAYFSEVADRQNSNSVKTKQVMRQRALLSLNCGGRSIGSSGGGTLSQLQAVPISMRILTSLLDALSSGARVIIGATSKLEKSSLNAQSTFSPSGPTDNARLRLMSAITDAGGIALPMDIPPSLRLRNQHTADGELLSKQSALALEAVTSAYSATIGVDVPAFKRKSSVQVPTWGPNSQGGGAEPSSRYSPYIVHCVCSPNTSRYIAATSDNDVIILDCDSLGVRGVLPAMRPYGPLYTASSMYTTISGSTVNSGGGVNKAVPGGGGGGGPILNPSEVTAQTKSVMHAFSMDTIRGTVGGTSQHINRTKDEGLSTTPSLLLCDRSAFVTTVDHFILPLSLQMKPGLGDGGTASLPSLSPTRPSHNPSSAPMDAASFIQKHSQAVSDAHSNYGTSNATNAKSHRWKETPLFDDRTEGIVVFGCADSHLRLYHYGGNDLETLVLAHVEPFGSPPTITRYFPELKQLIVGTMDGNLYRLTSRTTNSSTLSSRQSASSTSKNGGATPRTATPQGDFDSYQRGRYATELHPYWFAQDQGGAPRDVLLWRKEALSYSLHSPITALCFITSDSCIAVGTASGVVAFFDADTFAPHHMRRTINFGSNDCLVGPDVGAADGSGFDGMPASVYCLAYSDDFDVLAVGGTISTPFFVTREGSPLALYGGSVTHEAAVCSVSFISGTSLFLSGDAMGAVRVWDVRKLQCIETLTPCPDEAATYQRTVGELNVLRAKRTAANRRALLARLASGFKTSSRSKHVSKKEAPRGSKLIEDDGDERARDRYNTMADSTVLRWLQRAKTDESARFARSQRLLKANSLHNKDGNSGGGEIDPASSLRPTTTVQLRRPLRNLVALNINFIEGTLDFVGARGVERYTHRWVPPAVPRTTNTNVMPQSTDGTKTTSFLPLPSNFIPTTRASFELLSKQDTIAAGGTSTTMVSESSLSGSSATSSFPSVQQPIGPVVWIKTVAVTSEMVNRSAMRTEGKRAATFERIFGVPRGTTIPTTLSTTTESCTPQQSSMTDCASDLPPYPPIDSPLATNPCFYPFQTRTNAPTTSYTTTGHTLVVSVTSTSVIIWDAVSGIMCLEDGPIPVVALHKAHLQSVHDEFERASAERIDKVLKLRHSLNGILEGLKTAQEACAPIPPATSYPKSTPHFRPTPEVGLQSVESQSLLIPATTKIGAGGTKKKAVVSIMDPSSLPPPLTSTLPTANPSSSSSPQHAPASTMLQRLKDVEDALGDPPVLPHYYESPGAFNGTLHFGASSTGSHQPTKYLRDVELMSGDIFYLGRRGDSHLALTIKDTSGTFSDRDTSTAAMMNNDIILVLHLGTRCGRVIELVLAVEYTQPPTSSINGSLLLPVCSIRCDYPTPPPPSSSPSPEHLTYGGSSSKLGHIHPPLEVPYFLKSASPLDPPQYPIRTVLKPQDFFIEDDVEQRRQIRRQEFKMRRHYALERARRHAMRRRRRHAEGHQQTAEDAKRAFSVRRSSSVVSINHVEDEDNSDVGCNSTRTRSFGGLSKKSGDTTIRGGMVETPFTGSWNPFIPAPTDRHSMLVSTRAQQRREEERRQEKEERRADIINYRSMVMMHFQHNRNTAQSALSRTDVVHVDDVQRCLISEDYESSVITKGVSPTTPYSTSDATTTSTTKYDFPDGRGVQFVQHTAAANPQAPVTTPLRDTDDAAKLSVANRNVVLYCGVLPMLVTEERDGERGYYRDLLLHDSSDLSSDEAVTREITFLRQSAKAERRKKKQSKELSVSSSDHEDDSQSSSLDDDTSSDSLSDWAKEDEGPRLSRSSLGMPPSAAGLAPSRSLFAPHPLQDSTPVVPTAERTRLEDAYTRACTLCHEGRAIAKFVERRSVADAAVGAEVVSPSAPFYTNKADWRSMDILSYGDVDAELATEEGVSGVDGTFSPQTPSSSQRTVSLRQHQQELSTFTPQSRPLLPTSNTTPNLSPMHTIITPGKSTRLRAPHTGSGQFITEQNRVASHLGKTMPTPAPLFSTYRRQVLHHEKVFGCVMRQGGAADVRLSSDTAGGSASDSRSRSNSRSMQDSLREQYIPPTTVDPTGPNTPHREKCFLYCLFATANNSQMFTVYQRQRISIRSRHEIQRNSQRSMLANNERRRHTLFNGGFTPMVSGDTPILLSASGRQKQRYAYHWVRVRVDMIRSMPDFADCIRSWHVSIAGHHTGFTADTSGGVHWTVFPNVEEKASDTTSTSTTTKSALKVDDNDADTPDKNQKFLVDGSVDEGISLTSHSMRPVCIARFSTPVMPSDTHIPQCVGVAYLERSSTLGGGRVVVANSRISNPSHSGDDPIRSSITPAASTTMIHDAEGTVIMPHAHHVVGAGGVSDLNTTVTPSVSNKVGSRSTIGVMNVGPKASSSVFTSSEFQPTDQLVCVCGKSGMVGLYDVREVAASVLFAGDPIVGRRNLFDMSRIHDHSRHSHHKRFLTADLQRQLHRVLEVQQAIETSVEAVPVPIVPGSAADADDGENIVAAMEKLLGVVATPSSNLHGSMANALLLEGSGGASAMDLLTKYQMRLFSRGSFTPPPPRLVHQFVVGGGGEGVDGRTTIPDAVIQSARTRTVTSMCHVPSQSLLIFGTSQLQRAYHPPNSNVSSPPSLATMYFTHTYWGVPLSALDATRYLVQSPLRGILPTTSQSPPVVQQQQLIGNGTVVEFGVSRVVEDSLKNHHPQGAGSGGPPARKSKSMSGFGADYDEEQDGVFTHPRAGHPRNRKEAKLAADRLDEERRLCGSWVSCVKVCTPPLLSDVPPPFGTRTPTESAQYALCASRIWRKVRSIEASSPRTVAIATNRTLDAAMLASSNTHNNGDDLVEATGDADGQPNPASLVVEENKTTVVGEYERVLQGPLPLTVTAIGDTAILLPTTDEECPTPARSHSAGGVRSRDVVRRSAQHASKNPQIRRPATANQTSSTTAKAGATMPSSIGKLVDVLVGISTPVSNLPDTSKSPSMPDDGAVEPPLSSRPLPRRGNLTKSANLSRRPLSDDDGARSSSSVPGESITPTTHRSHKSDQALGARLIRSEVEANSRESLLRTALVSVMGDGIGTTRITQAQQKIAARLADDPVETGDILERHQHEWVGHIQLSTRVRACSRSSKPVLVEDLLTSVGSAALQDNHCKPVSLLAEIRRRQGHTWNESRSSNNAPNNKASTTNSPFATTSSSSIPPKPSPYPTVGPMDVPLAKKGAGSRTVGTGKLLHRI